MVETNLELYRIFLSVCEHSNITKASNSLHISQPAVTQSIKHLEDQLDTNLFIRTKRGVILTEEGQSLYKYIKEAFEVIKNGENKILELKNLDSGTIQIGVNTTITKEFLMPYLRKFHELHPKVRISFKKGTASEFLALLRNGNIDLMFLNLPFKADNDIKIIPCKTLHDAFVVNKDFKDISNKIINASSLNKYPLILQSKSSNTRKFIDDLAYKNGVILNPIMEVESYSLVYELTKIGMGIGYLTQEYIVDELNNNELFILKTSFSIPERKIGIAIKKESVMRFVLKEFINLIIEDINK